MDGDVKLSIITPTFNAAKDIEVCLLSVATQTFPSKEHLIIDGGSSDSTLEIVRQYAEQYPHIRFISEKDDGIYDAMNKGIERARGEWLYFLGSDDVLYDDGVIDQIFGMKDIDECDFVYGNVLWGDTGTFYAGEFTQPKLMLQNICHQAIFYKKSLFTHLGGYDVRYRIWADYLFNIVAFTTKNITIKYVDTVIARFAFNGASSKAVVDEVFLRDRESIYRAHFPAESVELYYRLQGLAKENESLQQVLAVRNQQLSDRDQQLSDRDQQLADRDRQLADLNRLLDIKLGQIVNLEQALAATHKSLSWRVTKPLRSIADIIK